MSLQNSLGVIKMAKHYSEKRLKEYVTIKDKITEGSNFCPFCKNQLMNNKVCVNGCQKVMDEFKELAEIVNILNQELEKLFNRFNNNLPIAEGVWLIYRVVKAKGDNETFKFGSMDHKGWQIAYDGNSGNIGFVNWYDYDDNTEDLGLDRTNLIDFNLDDRLRIIEILPKFIKQIHNKLLGKTQLTFRAFTILGRTTAMLEVMNKTKSIQEETKEFVSFLNRWKKTWFE